MTFKPQSSTIGAAEFANRRANAVAATRYKRYDALLVCSRGGGTLDRFGDVLYLTNYYSPFPYIPDLESNWTARAHGFLVLPVNGDPLLVADVPYLSDVA